MRCMGCGSAAVSERLEHTARGYRRFRCPQLRLSCLELARRHGG
jgi:hypothetical protein